MALGLVLERSFGVWGFGIERFRALDSRFGGLSFGVQALVNLGGLGFETMLPSRSISLCAVCLDRRRLGVLCLASLQRCDKQPCSARAVGVFQVAGLRISGTLNPT